MTSDKKDEVKNGEHTDGQEAGKPESYEKPEKDSTGGQNNNTGKKDLNDYEDFQKKYDELNDKFLRLAADFENYKKRAEKERAQTRIAVIKELVTSILGILDSLELALRHGKQSDEDGKGLIEGVQLTYNQSVSQLKNLGISQLSAEAGDKFNPALHEAIEKRPSEKMEEGLIIRETEKGYSAGETLIRPARVVVSSGAEKQSSGNEKQEQ